MEQFLKFVAEVMGVDESEISMETEYKEYDKWDSLMMLTLVMEIDAEYGTSIPLEGLGKVKKIKDLYAFVDR